MEENVLSSIEQTISDHSIVLFMKGTKNFPQCGFSAQVVTLLSESGVLFHTVDVLKSMELRQGIKEFSDWPTIPQLYVDGEFIGGCDIVQEMSSSGELTTLLTQYRTDLDKN